MNEDLAKAALDTINKLKAEVADLRKALAAKGDEGSILKAREARALEPGLDSPGVLPGTAAIRKGIGLGPEAEAIIAKGREARKARGQ